ncbi:hypothetical protein [Streptomyces bacillaris]|uniref:hypothetical protein n=1 Tax=Streptomyces bacillaris TaxID=68179 RepID=UPI00365F95FA
MKSAARAAVQGLTTCVLAIGLLGAGAPVALAVAPAGTSAFANASLPMEVPASCIKFTVDESLQDPIVDIAGVALYRWAPNYYIQSRLTASEYLGWFTYGRRIDLALNNGSLTTIQKYQEVTAALNAYAVNNPARQQVVHSLVTEYCDSRMG